MFLYELNQTEKENFISLAVDAANANGELADEEYLMLQEYCREMLIPYFEADRAKSVSEIIPEFARSTARVKKIVIFELIGLLVADGEFDNKEKNFLKEFSNGIGVNDKEVDKLTDLFNEYMDLSKKISETLG